MTSRIVLAAFAAVFLMGGASLAATIDFSWDGGNGLWDDTNWNGGQAGPGFDFGDVDPAPNALIDTGDTVDATSTGLVLRNNGVDVTKITLDGGSTLNAGALDVNGDLAIVEILDGNLVVNTELRLDGANGANAEVQLHKGLITLNASHPLKGNNNFFQDDHINFLGAAGDAEVLYTQTNSNSARTLAGRVARGYFSIDSTVIDPAANESDLGVLNAELATLAVGGRHFVVAEANGEQTLSLVTAIPEPTSAALAVLAGLLAARRSR